MRVCTLKYNPQVSDGGQEVAAAARLKCSEDKRCGSGGSGDRVPTVADAIVDSRAVCTGLTRVEIHPTIGISMIVAACDAGAYARTRRIQL